MKTYAIRITDKDGYSGEIHVSARNKTEAREDAKLYIRQWRLTGSKIDYIREA